MPKAGVHRRELRSIGKNGPAKASLGQRASRRCKTFEARRKLEAGWRYGYVPCGAHH